MVRFSLFALPVSVEPWFWVMAFVLGRDLDIRDRESLISTVIFAALVFISILVHELGHALSGRWLAGGRQSIRLWGFGGLAYNEGGRWTRTRRIIMILAGPGAGFLLFGAVVAGILVAFPGKAGWELCRFLVVGGDIPKDQSVLEFFAAKPRLIEVLYQLLWINLWWGLVNLLPVHPLDGGQVAAEFIPSQRRVHLIGTITGAGVAAAAFVHGHSYAALLFGFLAWQNFQNMNRPRF